MPYSIDNPPDRINGLPKHAQEIWISAYNSAYEQYNQEEERANKVAWAAVKNKYKKVGDKWLAKCIEIPNEELIEYLLKEHIRVHSFKNPLEGSAAVDMHTELVKDMYNAGLRHIRVSSLELDSMLSEDLVKQSSKSIGFFKDYPSKQIVIGVVFEPYLIDLQKEWMSPEDIEEAAHDYLRKSRKIKLSHKSDVSHEVDIVESYICPASFLSKDGIVLKSSWVAGVYVDNSNLWKDIINGTILGFSAGGTKDIY